MPGPAFAAVLLDIDGTLVDSNYLHIEAWSRAFADVGAPVAAWRIHRCMGMDSAKLLDALLGDGVERFGDEAKAKHSEYYLAMADRLRPFEDAQDLLRTLAARGFRVVLATSAPAEEFALLQRTLQVDDAIAEYTTSEDVGQAKPAPDIVEVALQRAGVAAEEAIMVGDAVWDVDAARRSGVPTIGLRSGGVSAAELQEAGAVAVYEDPAQLLRELDASPLISA
ncbi:HAD family hydrolase [Amnibacterium sp. CER49]|uniref:HAD family hydrolase n=1 Tax=Amnibacterium sp. CER49 TaxID=3039161 RepID=UPI0024498243|nr:HAD family hydrolase [Amnibacterium sp. CER49]MDH2442681.1 HAD family hydrolase [Amnibacterium sp. CER49]